jgi:hypothetical protein
MTADEAIVFVNFDSEAAAPQFVMHGAVDLGDSTELQQELEEAACRTSIEVRLLVLIQQDHRDACDDETNSMVRVEDHCSAP